MKRHRAETSPAIQIDYYDRWVIVGIAIFVGIFMVVYAFHRPFGEVIWEMDFYKAAVPSCIASAMVLFKVSRAVRMLDATHPWTIRPAARLVLQLYHGVFLPAMILLGFFAVYFIERGHVDRLEAYYRLDFPFALVLLLGINVLYMVYYLYRIRQLKRAFHQWRRAMAPPMTGLPPAPVIQLLEATPPPADIDPLSLIDREAFVLRQATNVAYFETDGLKNAVWANRMDGSKAIELFAVEQLDQLLAGPHFFCYSKGKVVNRAAIVDVRPQGRSWVISLGGAYAGMELTVSRRRAAAFKTWWEQS